MTETALITRDDVKAGVYTAYLAQPDNTSQKLPAVIILHEIFGLNDNIKDIARRFAREGYVALAVDMFSFGKIKVLCLLQTVGGIFRGAVKSGHMGKLEGTSQWLKQQPGVDPERIGVIGFCMGGGYALALGITSQQVKASSVFYGVTSKPYEDALKSCPIVASYPDKDFTTKGAREIEKVLDNSDRPHDFKYYPAAHSFFNDTVKAYNADAASDAWRRTMEFFRQHV